MADRPSRIAEDLFESALVEGARQSRSAKQQLDHWARVGRAVSMHHTAARLRVEDVLAGRLAMSELTGPEHEVVNAELDALIQERAVDMHFGAQLAGEGVVTVALDENGQLMRHHPDGTVTPLEPASTADSA